MGNTVGELRRYILALQCRLCGRSRDLPVSALGLPPETPLAEALARLRCSTCAARGGHDMRLVYASEGTPFDPPGASG